MRDDPYHRVRRAGYEIRFLVGTGEDPATIDDVDMWLTTDDGDRWCATMLTLDRIRQIMDHEAVVGERSVGWFRCSDALVVRAPGLDAMTAVVDALVSRDEFRHVLHHLGPEDPDEPGAGAAAEAPAVRELRDGTRRGALTREAVLRTLAEYDRLGAEAFLHTYGYGSATRYLLVHDGKDYDSKAVAGVAHRYCQGRPLERHEFNGGRRQAVRWLTDAGFEVRDTWAEPGAGSGAPPAT